MKLSTRLGLIVLASVLGMSILGGYALLSLRTTMVEERKAGVGMLVRLASKQVEHFQEQEKSGKLTREQAQAAARDAIRGLRDGDDFVFVRSGNGLKLSLVHPDPRKEGKESDGGKLPDGRTVVQAYEEVLSQGNFGYAHVYTKRPKGDVAVPKISAIERIPDWGWVIGSGAFVDDIDAAFWRYAATFAGLGAVLVLAVTALAVSLSRGIFKSIGGEPAYAAEVARAIAAGDLTRGISRRGGADSLLAAVADMQENLKRMIGQIRAGADTVSRSGDALTQQMSQINLAAHRSADATASTAAAIQEMAVSVAQISDNANESRLNSERATELANTGGQLVEQVSAELKLVATQVGDASERIEGLEERSREIDGIARVIKEIADQTNLLALNAAIEAARAGEQGRGFAVVADEVRKLAERSGKATDQIAETIRSIQTDTIAVVTSMRAVTPQVAKGVEVAASASQALREINDGAGKTLANIQEVSHSTSEQRLASDNVAASVEQISQMVEEMATSVAQANDNVQALEHLAVELRDSVTRFRA